MSALAAHLIEAGLLSPKDLIRVEDVRVRANARLPATLVRLGMVSEGDLADGLAKALGLARLDRGRFPRALPEIEGLNHRFLSRHAVLPLMLESGRLQLAMADPEDDVAVGALRFATSAEQVERVVATFADIEEAIAASAPTPDDMGELLGFGSGSTDDDIERLIEGESEAPVIRLVQRLLANAVNRRASDVHIEPMARHVAVRYRIDGQLVEVETLSDTLAEPIASRIKVMASLDIAESRLPQDGRLKLTVRGRDVDVRVSTSPIAYGESIVMRLLGRSEVPLDLDRLGLPQAALQKLERALARPHGMILLTGPTGSGKSTTLYAAINRLRRPEVKILTVEDPVEVLLEGVNQVQVRPEIDLSYAATLRAFLRQDPDILMIGEIRDQETAEIAMRAALTGHLVLSTLHTNSAIGAFTRLGDIGIEPFLTASTVIATIAQRLIRSVCPTCAEERTLKPKEAKMFASANMAAPKHIKEGKGCASCQQTGYKGRIPLIEILEVDEPLRDAIREGRTESLSAINPIDQTLFGHGLSLVAAGRTTLAEVERAVRLA